MEHDTIELKEKDGKGRIKINNTDINSVINYSLKRNTDTVDVTLTISVPIKKFKTIEN